ncbi:MAG: ABC transporter substrate-binding protein [Acidimicrobiales bacterium]
MTRLPVALVLLLALIAAACASDSDEVAGSDTTSSTTTTANAADGTAAPVETTASTTTSVRVAEPHPGVTDDSIDVGVVALDWEALAELGVDLGRGTSIDLYTAALEVINENGGVHGRMIELHPQVVFPVGSEESDAACVALTEDIEVFVTFGAMLGDAVLCYTELHESAVIGAASRSDERIARARAPYVTVIGAQSDSARNFVSLMDEQGLLEGRTIGVLGAVDVDEATYDAVFAALVEAGYDPVPGLIGGNNDDLTGSAADQGIILERMTAAGVEVTVSTVGVPLVITNAIDAGYETDQWLFSGLPSAAALADAAVDFDYLEGAVGVSPSPVGTSDQLTLDQDPLTADCLDRLSEATGRELSLALDGQPNDLNSYLFSCSGAVILQQALELAGPELDEASFAAALESIGDITLPGYGAGNLSPGHLGAVDTLRLVEFDHESGAWNVVE